jgi:hypothetical protein
MVYEADENLKLHPVYAHEIGRKVVNRVKPAHLNSMQASDEDSEHTIGRTATRRPSLDHNMVYETGEKLKLYLISTCFLVRFYEYLNVSERSVRGRSAIMLGRPRVGPGGSMGAGRQGLTRDDGARLLAGTARTACA